MDGEAEPAAGDAGPETGHGPGPLARAIGLALVTRHELRLSHRGDERLDGLTGDFELAAGAWTGAAAAVVVCYRPPRDAAEAAADAVRRVAAALDWGQRRLERQHAERCDVLLIALEALPPALGPVLDRRGEVRVGLLAVDSAGGRVSEVLGGVRGLPGARLVAREVDALRRGQPAPTLAAVDLAERQVVASGYGRRSAAPTLRPPARQSGRLATVTAFGRGLSQYTVLVVRSSSSQATVVSLLLSAAAVSFLYGWTLGVGLMFLLLIHEIGHMVVCLHDGIPVSGPVFIGPFGAFVHHQHAAGARQQANISVAGPAAGVLAALLVTGVAFALPSPGARVAVAAVAQWGFGLNLLNLVPVGPLDGARVVAAIRWTTFAAVAAGVALVYAGAGLLAWPANPAVLAVCGVAVLMAVLSLRERDERRAAGGGSVLQVVYVATVLISVAGMSLTASQLLRPTVVSLAAISADQPRQTPTGDPQLRPSLAYEHRHADGLARRQTRSGHA